MRNKAVFMLMFLLAGSSIADDAQADSLIRAEVFRFMEALQTGDGETAAAMFSSQAIDQVEVMLNTIKQSLDRDPEATLRRLNGVGYQVDAETAENWEPAAYLAQTLSLPMISARYVPYQLVIDSVTVNGRTATVQMTFRTAAGAEIPQQALMDREDDEWKVTNFMGITAFP